MILITDQIALDVSHLNIMKLINEVGEGGEYSVDILIILTAICDTCMHIAQLIKDKEKCAQQ